MSKAKIDDGFQTEYLQKKSSAIKHSINKQSQCFKQINCDENHLACE